MIKGLETKTIRINKPVLGMKGGQTVKAKFKSGVCTSPVMRRLLDDAKTDGCVEIIAKPSRKKKDNI